MKTNKQKSVMILQDYENNLNQLIEDVLEADESLGIEGDFEGGDFGIHIPNTCNLLGCSESDFHDMFQRYYDLGYYNVDGLYLVELI